MSNNLNSRKPPDVIMQICPVVSITGMKNGMAKKVIAWPASSSATTSRGSFLPVAAIAAGANFTQIIEPAIAKAAITIDIEGPDK